MIPNKSLIQFCSTRALCPKQPSSFFHHTDPFPHASAPTQLLVWDVSNMCRLTVAVVVNQPSATPSIPGRQCVTEEQPR